MYRHRSVSVIVRVRCEKDLYNAYGTYVCSFPCAIANNDILLVYAMISRLYLDMYSKWGLTDMY